MLPCADSSRRFLSQNSPYSLNNRRYIFTSLSFFFLFCSKLIINNGINFLPFLTRICRIHSLHLCRGVRPPSNECPGYDTKQSDDEVPTVLELSGMQSTPSLPLLPGPLCLFVAASHQTRLDTWSKARRPIKVGIKGRGRSGTSKDSNPGGLCCSSAHLVQAVSRTQIWVWARMPGYGLN